MKSILLWSALALAAAPQSSSPPPTAPAAANVWDGVYTEAQARRGEKLGAQHCAGCHGLDLNSGEPGPWLYADDFAKRYANHTVADLMRRLNTMPPDTPGALGPEAMADFAAFVLWSNDFPVGARELPHDLAALERIRITIKKP